MSSLRYRFASPVDLPAAIALLTHSFPGGGRTPEWWSEQVATPPYGGGAETLLLGESGGRIVAACQIHPLREWIGGQMLPTAGVGSVAISPTHRQRRLGAALVTQALRAARERGDVASALYPFRSSFYQKLGYGHAGEVLQYQVAPSALPSMEERLCVELLDTSDAQRAAFRLYNMWARTQTGQLERNEHLWNQLCTAADHALFGCRGEDDALEGYALVAYRMDLPRRERYLEVVELVWTTTMARRALYGWLATLGDQWEQLLLRALPSHRLGDWLREPRLPHGAAPMWSLWVPAATLMVGPMFRLLEVRAALKRRAIAEGEPLEVALEVRDAEIPENEGRLQLRLADGRVAIMRSGTVACTLRLDVSTLSRLYIGALAPTAAFTAGLLECDRPELLPRLDAALLLPEPWTFDRF